MKNSQAALIAAASYAAGRPHIRSSDVLSYADKWMNWLELKDIETEEGLTS